MPGPAAAGPGAARPADGPLQPHPLRRPQHVAGPPGSRTGRELLGRWRPPPPAASTRRAGRRATSAAAPTWGSSPAPPSSPRSVRTTRTSRRGPRSAACAPRRTRIDELVGDRRLVVRVDRLEPSKNLLRGFWAFDELLETHPQWRGQVVMLALGYASRETLAEYLAYGTEVEHAVARVNETWGTDDWCPIVLDVADDPDRSFAALTRYDVLLVNPMRDGLNLVAKEGPLVNDNDGVLALSREAGAFEELRRAVARDQSLRRGRHRRRAGPGAGHAGAASGPGGPPRLRALVERRQAGDWLADLLAAAGA